MREAEGLRGGGGGRGGGGFRRGPASPCSHLAPLLTAVTMPGRGVPDALKARTVVPRGTQRMPAVDTHGVCGTPQTMSGSVRGAESPAAPPLPPNGAGISGSKVLPPAPPGIAPKLARDAVRRGETTATAGEELRAVGERLESFPKNDRPPPTATSRTHGPSNDSERTPPDVWLGAAVEAATATWPAGISDRTCFEKHLLQRLPSGLVPRQATHEPTARPRSTFPHERHVYSVTERRGLSTGERFPAASESSGRRPSSAATDMPSVPHNRSSHEGGNVNL